MKILENETKNNILTAKIMIEADEYNSKINPENYKDIVVKFPLGNESAFYEAVISETTKSIKVAIPEAMVEQKLNALLAEQKMMISQDPIYNVLGDMVEILKKAYKVTGISRPMAQVRSEAMDIMLQTMSKDQKEPSKEHLYFLLKGMKL